MNHTASPFLRGSPMPRKSKNAKAEATPTDNEAQATSNEEQGAGAKSAPGGRTPGGQFAAGNPGGPGNPHARACARMLQMFRDNFTDDEMMQICRMLYVKAVGGDISAAKIILSYKIGKPLPAPHPDSIDRDEWDHYQNDAVREQEMKLAMSSLPTHAGNDIIRTALPIMTASRMKDFAAQLVEGLPPKAERGEGREEEGERTNSQEPPTANGKMNGQSGQEPTQKAPIANGKSEEESTRKAPIANGKMSGKPGQEQTQKSPIANGKIERSQRIDLTQQALDPAGVTVASASKSVSKESKTKRRRAKAASVRA